MKQTKKNIKAAAEAYVATRNLTQLCRTMKMMGIVTRHDIYHACCDVLSQKKQRGLFTELCDVSANRCYDNGTHLHRDLNVKSEWIDYVPQNLLQRMSRNKQSGNYMKILIVGDKHIWWAHPHYKHDDYNKSRWAENTPENRRKAEIINRFLLK